MSEESLIPHKCWIGPKQLKIGFKNKESERGSLGDKWKKEELGNEKSLTRRRESSVSEKIIRKLSFRSFKWKQTTATYVWLKLVNRHLFTPQSFKSNYNYRQYQCVCTASYVLNVTLDNMQHEHSVSRGFPDGS